MLPRTTCCSWLLLACLVAGCGDGSTVEERRWADGTIKQEQTLRPGPDGVLVPDGPTRIYYPNGAMQEERNYQAGQLHGTLTLWHENGQKEAESEWENGRMVRDWTRWDEQGNEVDGS